MSIKTNPKHDPTPSDKNALRNVYEDQMRDYRHEFLAAERQVQETANANSRYMTAIERRAKIEGQMDALRMLAARDGVTLKKEM